MLAFDLFKQQIVDNRGFQNHPAEAVKLGRAALNEMQPIVVNGLNFLAADQLKKNNEIVQAPDFRLPFDQTWIEMSKVPISPTVILNEHHAYAFHLFEEEIHSVIGTIQKAKEFLEENPHRRLPYYYESLLEMNREGEVSNMFLKHSKALIVNFGGWSATGHEPIMTALSPILKDRVIDRPLASLHKPHSVYGRIASNAFQLVIACINIINTRNASLHNQAPEKISTKNKRRTGLKKGHSYKIVYINDQSTYRTTPITDQEAQDSNAEHYCRGNFAYYSKEKPMFGNPKNVGRYWRKPHLKGKNKQARIDHTYVAQ